jgi:tRNA pseudouridine38-40 synthase
MRNIRLVIAYDGAEFHGWQRQSSAPTVQGCLEAVIGKIVGGPVHVWGSGRTDAGVHALGQVANFKTDCPIPCENLIRALNDGLPPTVRIKEAHEVSESFHARYDVRAKTYRYRILQAPICSPFLWRFVCHHPYPLDHKAMAEAARALEGEHDFSSFAAVEAAETKEGFPDSVMETHAPQQGRDHRKGASRPSLHRVGSEMVRRIFVSRILWRPRTSLLVYEVCGSGFLHHMVRNIVGTLMEVGRGKLKPQDVTRILAARDRTLAGPTAPARGLCLMRVEY